MGVVEGFRWAILGMDMDIHWPVFLAGTNRCDGCPIDRLRYFRGREFYPMYY